jgi:small subunit ribosomal protein S18
MRETSSELKSSDIDYKNVELLKQYINPHGRIIGKRNTGISAKHQRQIATAIKRARFMGLLAYTSR